jgi:hypothetical protein
VVVFKESDPLISLPGPAVDYELLLQEQVLGHRLI